jgi:hypothetical protein
MSDRTDSALRRLAMSIQRRPALVHITANPRLARFLIAAGAKPGPSVTAGSRMQRRAGPRDAQAIEADYSRPRGDTRQRDLTDDFRMQTRELAVRDLAVRGLMREFDELPRPHGELTLLGPAETYLLREMQSQMWRATTAQVKVGDYLRKTQSGQASVPETAQELVSQYSRASGVIGDLLNMAGIARTNDFKVRPATDRDRYAEEIGSLLEELRGLIPEARLAGVNLRRISIDRRDLHGATWSDATIWPTADLAAWARAESTEISAGIYKIADERERQPDPT